MKKLTDQVTFRHGATLNNRLVQAPMLITKPFRRTPWITTLSVPSRRGWSSLSTPRSARMVVRPEAGSKIVNS